MSNLGGNFHKDMVSTVCLSKVWYTQGVSM